MRNLDRLGKIGPNLYRCDLCRKSVRKNDTLVLYNKEKKRQLRLCRDCQLQVYLDELKEENPGVDISLKVEDWSKNIRDGIDNRS